MHSFFGFLKKILMLFHEEIVPQIVDLKINEEKIRHFNSSICYFVHLDGLAVSFFRSALKKLHFPLTASIP
jgi:hypothetical protein